MLSHRNHIYGLVIGGAIADAMGTVAMYAPELNVTTPYSSETVGIKPGYWSEPTGLFLARLERISTEGTEAVTSPVMCPGMQTCIGNITNYPILSQVIQAAVLSIKVPDHEAQINITKRTALDKISNDAVLLWLAILDGIIHGMSKKNLYRMDLYNYLNLVPEVLQVIQYPPISNIIDLLPLDLRLMQEVLVAFRETNNFREGLLRVVNTSMHPQWTGTLYGQLAGCYYGITDIPEDWMDCVQYSEYLLK